MADDWEDWEDEGFKPQLPGTKKEIDAKFEGEDEDLNAAPAPSQPKTQPKKEKEKKPEPKHVVIDEPLEDPVAEKARQQRLQEEADFKATRELFGDVAAGPRLEDMLPKSEKDYADFATALVHRYVEPHSTSKHYKHLVKIMIREAVKAEVLTAGEVKDLETALAGLRTDKLKAEQAAAAAKKLEGKKKVVNVGRSGGSAGLDDYVYDDALDDDNDFM